MKRITRTSLIAAAAVLLYSCAGDRGILSNVDPYIGSGGHGHVFVGANVPFGAIQAGPQNIHKGWDWCSGYHYSDSVIIGFAHTHLSGTGCTDLGDIQIMPFNGALRCHRGSQDNIEGSCSSYYSHENETVSPGYYSLLMDNGIREEMTTTDRVAIHNITWPDAGTSRMLINLDEGNGDGAYESCLKLVDKNTVQGWRFSNGWTRHCVFFVLKTDTDIAEFNTYSGDTPSEGTEILCRGVKGVITFGDVKNVKVKVAISSVSCDNAAENLTTELPGWDFDEVRKTAERRWADALGVISAESTSDDVLKIFYTALYHTYMAPVTYCDVNGEFRGHDDKIIKGDWHNYSVFSLWDTYRALHPLFSVIHTAELPDMVNSMLSIYEQQSKLPIWPLVGGETNCMPGYSAVPVISDAIIKGIGGFDVEKAYNYMKASTVYPLQVAVPFVLEKGYIPDDKKSEATSIAMEYAVGDWGVAQAAKKLGKADDYKEYLKRGRYWKQYFDTDINFIRPKLDDGSWLTPYDPFESIHGVGHFCEGNGWQYTFFVPQEPEALIEIMGGDKVFCDKLDEFFRAEGDMGEHASADISGLIGMYAHGNEPSHHVAYMYAYVGEQWKTAEKVRYIMDEFYTTGKDGIIGNEDCGQMSAWYILSAMGFYQVNPSNGVFVFGSPLLDRTVITLPEGKQFVVKALGNPAANKYIQSVKLNGKPYTKSYILYEDIMAGGELEFTMGPEPQKAFGASEADRPHTVI